MKKISLLCVVFALMAFPAFAATSTVNPNIPAQNSPLTSAPLRANALATYNDITAILNSIVNIFTPSTDGLVPSPNGVDSTHFLAANGGWLVPPASEPAGTLGQLQYNGGGSLGALTISGDCSLVYTTGILTCLKTGGVNFAASATTDTTNASNINSGTLGLSRLGQSYTNGQLLIGSTSTGLFVPANLTAGSGVSITNAGGSITISATGGGGGTGITQLTGDVTAIGTGSVPATLATVNSNVGSFTSANITVNAKGLITAASNGTGGGGPPGGTNGQVQFNNADAFDGSSLINIGSQSIAQGATIFLQPPIVASFSAGISSYDNDGKPYSTPPGNGLCLNNQQLVPCLAPQRISIGTTDVVQIPDANTQMVYNSPTGVEGVTLGSSVAGQGWGATFISAGTTTATVTAYGSTSNATFVIRAPLACKLQADNGGNFIIDPSQCPAVTNSYIPLGTSTATANPSRTGEANTGLYTPATGVIAILSSGTEIMRVTAIGLGIGTTSSIIAPLTLVGLGTTAPIGTTTGAMYMCVDGNGNTYKKASCP